MDIVNLIADYGGWSWIVAGLVLLGLELVVPGGVLIWLGAAAMLTGVIALFQVVSQPIQWVLFGILSLVGIVAWLRISRRQNLDVSDKPFLNRRAAKLIGQQAALSEPITDGYGRAVIGDSTWRVSGPDLPQGARVKVTGHDGTVLTVEADV